MEETKKKRGRPKKVQDASVNEVVTEKKKRGRPKKYNPYREFTEENQNIFKTYIEDYNNIITLFLSYKDKDIRISKNDWNIIYNHVKDINDKICEEDNVFHIFNNEYHYKPESSWKPLDAFREQQKLKFIDDFYNNPLDKNDTVYNGYMIYSHLKLYIIESSKEQKI